MVPPTSLARPGLVLAALLLSAVPASGVTVPGATFTGPADFDTTYFVTPVAEPPFHAAYADEDGNGRPAAAEPVYLARGAAAAAGDIRLTPAGAAAGGTVVRASDDDAGEALPTLAASYCFSDADGDGGYGLGDVAVLHVGAAAASAVAAAGDVVLSGTGAFRRIAASSPLLNVPLSCALPAVGAAEVFFNADGSFTGAQPAYTIHDAVYLQLGTTRKAGLLGLADVRLTPRLGAQGGVQLGVLDLEVPYLFARRTVNPILSACFAESPGGLAGLDPTDAVYLAASLPCGQVAVGDLRLTHPTLPRAALVRGSDGDFGDGLEPTRPAPPYCFEDVDGSGEHSLADRVWLDLVGTGGDCARVDPADVFVTPGGSTPAFAAAGTSAVAAVGLRLGSRVGDERSFDADSRGGSGLDGLPSRRTAGDAVYLDWDATLTATPLDLRLTTAALLPAGSRVGLGDPDMWYSFSRAAPANAPSRLCGTHAAPQAGDTLVLQASAGAGPCAVSPLSVRLLDTAAGVAGRLVSATDPDAGQAVAAVPLAFCHDDPSGSPGYSYRDGVVLAPAACASLAAGDVALTESLFRLQAAAPTPAVQLAPLRAGASFPGLRHLDGDGEGGATRFTRGDVLYLDNDLWGSPTVCDVRLNGFSSASALAPDGPTSGSCPPGGAGPGGGGGGCDGRAECCPDGGCATPTRICVAKWRDADGDGRQDAGEAPVGGVTVFLDEDGDGMRDPGERAATTGADGRACFDVAPGRHRVAEVVPDGSQPTIPEDATYSETVQEGETLDLAFGNRPVPDTTTSTSTTTTTTTTSTTTTTTSLTVPCVGFNCGDGGDGTGPGTTTPGPGAAAAIALLALVVAARRRLAP